ncbi:MAG TPA: hypothetical protein VF323_11460, partial [Candidatus Limnocylindrales bacterium]
MTEPTLPQRPEPPASPEPSPFWAVPDPGTPVTPVAPPSWPVPDPATPAGPPTAPIWAAPSPTPAPAPSAGTPAGAYSPARLPTSEWARGTGPAGSGGSPEAWFEPVAAVPVPTERTRPAGQSRGSAGIIVAASLLAAVLASGGTLVALDATGALDRPVAAAATARPAIIPAGGIDQSSSVIAAAAKASPAVVQITSVAGIDPNNVSSLPDTGVGSGVIFDAD